MRILNRRALIGTILLPCLLLTACGRLATGQNEFRGGETVTPERLAELSAAVFSDGEPTAAAVPSEPDPALAGYDGTVFWTASGGVVHTDRTCYHLARASQVLEGSVTEAAAAGKTTLCASCRRAMTESESAP